MGNKANEFNYLIVYNYLKEGIQTVSTSENLDKEDLSKEEIILKSEINPENLYIKQENYQQLSAEAKEVIDIILNSPQEVLNLFLTPKRKHVSIAKLKTILAHCWNSTLLVESAFMEIRKWVKKL
jgi:hypothetical protein